MPIDSERPDPFIHHPTVFITLFSVISWGPRRIMFKYPSILANDGGDCYLEGDGVNVLMS